MPSAAARRVYEDQIPSFMSVFDLDAETMADRDTVTLVDPRLVESDAKTATLGDHTQQPCLAPGIAAHDPAHKHHDSTSTQMTESTESSPTTTLSTSDSSPLSDPSPSSSPDSPISVMPLNNFPPANFGSHFLKPSLTMPVSDPSTIERPMTSPAPRRPRNMKGLSIQPPGTFKSNTTVLASEPSSPSFIKPKIPGMKRKPSMLSLKTSTQDLNTRPTMEVPPSPGMPPILQRRALKHSTSSPHMFSSMKSSTFGPVGGMRLPNMLERNESGLSEVLRPSKVAVIPTTESTIEEEDSPIRSQLASRMDFDPYQEKEGNEDQKTPGYPDGPIAIYDDDVYLYLEPTAEEAAKFDVVINVAKEVQNPFELERAKRRMGSPMDIDPSPIPETAQTDASFSTAFEFPTTDDKSADTPTTPKANPFKEPEYIHMPWDHNTDIAPDLMDLCEKIDARVKEGKKVLIHCQQGASRSASLIIAYGLYKKPELSVNDSYYAAQSKSQWISPNMKLMYSLQDFQKNLSKLRLPPTSNYKPRTGRSPTKHRLTLSADAIEISTKEPRTAPLPGEEQREEESEASKVKNRSRGNSTPGNQGISPGPASAPPNMSWQQEVEANVPDLPTLTSNPPLVSELPQRLKLEPSALVNFSRKIDRTSQLPPPTPGFGPPAGFGFQSMDASTLHVPKKRAPQAPTTLSKEPVNRTVSVTSSYTPAYPSDDDDAIMSPRAERMTSNPLHDFTSVAGLRFTEVAPEPTEGLFSPRASSFNRDSLLTFGRPAQVADPRSPPMKGEAPIIRSIDDII